MIYNPLFPHKSHNRPWQINATQAVAACVQTDAFLSGVRRRFLIKIYPEKGARRSCAVSKKFNHEPHEPHKRAGTTSEFIQLFVWLVAALTMLLA
jgi:hypothetical protein